MTAALALRVMLASLVVVHAAAGTQAVGHVATGGCLRVCTSKTCRKAGSHTTLAMLRDLASTAAPESRTGTSAAMVQRAFAAAKVETCGCLGGCGNGPNVVNDVMGEVFNDVYKPRSGVALLREVGVDVADEAAQACVKQLYAERALRKNKPGEAVPLLTDALNRAGALKLRAAQLLHRLLDARADAREQMGDKAGAEEDRARADAMLARGYPAPAAAHAE